MKWSSCPLKNHAPTFAALRRYITDTWRKEDVTFVETEAYRYALEKCKKHTYITITGISGAGKSAMAYHIALQFEKQGYKIFPVTSVNEIKKYHDPAGDQIFILDDPYGLASVDTKKVEDIQRLSPAIDETFLHGNNKVIFTCRRQIVNSSEFKNTKCIVHKKIIDLHSVKLKLNISEKRQMFENHTETTDIHFDPDDILHADLSNFPLLCKMYGCNKNFQKEGKSFFTDPFSAILCDIDKLKEVSSHIYISLLLCAICDGWFDSDDYNERQLETQVGLLYKAIDDDRTALYANVTDGMDSLVNVYLVKEGSTYRFIHETLYEAVIYHFGKEYQNIMFRHSSYHFIQRYIAIVKSRGDQLQEHECDCLADRHIAEIYKGNFFDVFMNPFFEDNEIYISLIKKLDIQNSNELTRMMLETNTNVDLDRLNSIKSENIWNKSTVLQILLENKNVKALHWIIALNHSILFFYLFSKMSRLPAYHNDGSVSFVHIACFGGNTDIVAKLLQTGNAGSLKDNTGPLETSALHMAVYSRNHEMVKMVFERTVVSLTEVKNSFEATPLFQAAAMGLKSTCEFLLAKGAVVNTFAKGRLSPLWIAAQEGHTDVVKLLLAQKADPNHGDDFGTTPLYIAAEKGQEEVVKILLEHKAEVNICDKENTSPLYIASQNGLENIVEILLENKAKPNERDIYGESALYIAARNGHTAIVKKLLDYKAAANLCDNDGVSPLNIACHNGNVDAANVLLQYKAAINQLDRQGVSPLYIASQNGHTETVEFLLEHSANVYLRDRHDVSPLYIAAHNENVKTVEVLLRHEANVDQKTDDGATPLYIAAYRGRKDILEMLLNSKASVNICDNNGVSPLYMAAQNGFTGCIQILLERGADVNKRVKDDSTTPLYIATQNGHTDAVKILLNYGADASITDNEGNLP